MRKNAEGSKTNKPIKSVLTSPQEAPKRVPACHRAAAITRSIGYLTVINVITAPRREFTPIPTRTNRVADTPRFQDKR